ncbi:GTP 3',8-cyclase MoaA [Hahella sp. CCB-MM4]|uniref:GTP 3',8-cyclase MoaA n=1 Tax=Hahella sp. (strain CCB-MM4) TaxID=1926491 RepID=UPI000B9A1E5B|nr:GTP 3',8-cyclase MoaA [Hahella sp. CCB-MM4]
MPNYPSAVVQSGTAEAGQAYPTLEDTYGRRFQYLRLSVTEICNFRCNYCLPNGYQNVSKPLPLNQVEIDTLLQAFSALGTRKVRLTGGEPATRRDLDTLIAMAKSPPGIQKVALTTNGYNLKQKIASWKQAGLDAINVSVDSLDAAQFSRITGHDILPKVLAGIDRAIELGYSNIKINAVLLQQFNVDQLERFVDWVKHMPVTVRFIELMETSDNRVFFRENRITGESIKSRLMEQGWTEKQRDRFAGPAKEFSHPDYKGNIGLIMPYSKDFCATCNRLRVSSEGKLHLCLFGDSQVDLRPYLLQGDVVGTIRAIRQSLPIKKSGHALHDGYTGSTRHLASIGG